MTAGEASTMVETKAVTLPESVRSGVAALTAKRNVAVDSVVEEAILKYERTIAWQELRACGRERAAVGFVVVRRVCGSAGEGQGVPRSADNHPLESCLTGAADLLVSGDKDLLVLPVFRNVAIIPLRLFADEPAESRV